MKHYLNKLTNKVHAFERDGSQDHLITSDMIKIADHKVDLAIDASKKIALDAVPYDVKRKAEYPPIGDYLDAVVKGDAKQLQDYISACKAIKLKYPKPGQITEPVVEPIKEIPVTPIAKQITKPKKK